MDMRATIEIVTEASRAGNAVQLQEIPARYKHLRVINRGTTSVILEKDPATVLMLTRDSIKAEYLQDHGIAKWIERFGSFRNKNPAMNEHDIIVLELPKLERLKGPNIKLVRAALDEFTTELGKTFRYGRDAKRQREIAIQQMLQHFSAQEDHMLAPLCQFLLNYDINQYDFDLRPGNFMQTAEGEIVVLDPIVYKELMDIIWDAKKARYAA